MSVKEISSRYRWTALGLAFLAQFVNTLGVQAIPPLAPLVERELDLTKTEIGIFSSATFLGAWGVLAVAGFLTDRLGAGRIMGLGGIICGVALMAMATTGSFLQAVAIMFACGLARGSMLPGATKAITDWFTTSLRATAMGVKQTGFPVAGILTGSTLPAIALAVGWRNAIALTGILIAAGGIAILAFYREPPRSAVGPSPVSTARAGMKEVLRSRWLWVATGVALLYVTVQLAAISYLALYLNEVVLPPSVPDPGVRLVVAGGLLALCQAGGVAGRILWGMLSDWALEGRRMGVLAVIGAVIALVSAVFAYLPPGAPMGLLGALMILYGLSAIGYNGLYHTLIVETVDPRLSATAVGLSMSVVQIGIVGGAPLFGFVVDMTRSYQPAWLLLALLGALGGIIAAASAPHEKARV